MRRVFRGEMRGRAAGIIETHNLPDLIDSVGLLAGSAAWSQAHQRKLQSWFTAFLTSLLDSAEGRAEAQAENNHGSWYDVQVASFGLFTDRRDIADRVLSQIPRKRIARQIKPDGSQPLELARAQPWRYSLFNLEALFEAAALGDHVAMDLWNFETADKRSVRKALDWLIPGYSILLPVHFWPHLFKETFSLQFVEQPLVDIFAHVGVKPDFRRTLCQHIDGGAHAFVRHARR